VSSPSGAECVKAPTISNFSSALADDFTVICDMLSIKQNEGFSGLLQGISEHIIAIVCQPGLPEFQLPISSQLTNY
jgi:hypothetical protein